MSEGIVTAEQAVQIGIGLYGKVITEKTDGQIYSENKRILCPDMFGECIFCQLEGKIQCSDRMLKEIKKELKGGFLVWDKRIQQFRLEEILLRRRTDNFTNVLFIMIAYVAFQINENELKFLQSFVKLQTVYLTNDLPEDKELQQIEKNLGTQWVTHIQELSGKHFTNCLAEQKCLDVLSKRLETELENIKRRKKDVPFYTEESIT